jgi:hypothetical protein
MMQSLKVSAMALSTRKVKESADDSAEAVTRLSEVTDKMHGPLMDRADAVIGCIEGSAEETELAMLTDIIGSAGRLVKCPAKVSP